MLERLAEFQMPELLLKRGHPGLQVFTDGEELGIARLQAAGQLIDTTGAGDCFNSAYSVNRLGGAGVIDSTQAAHSLALKVIAHPGAILAT